MILTELPALRTMVPNQVAEYRHDIPVNAAHGIVRVS